MTQTELKKIIVEYGGRVKLSIPFRQKGVSTKKYVHRIVWKKKVPGVIKIALRKKCKILSFSYIFACLERHSTGPVNEDDFLLNTKKLGIHLTKETSIGRKHFHKIKTFISIMKKARKAKLNKARHSETILKRKPRNPAQFFVSSCLNKQSEILPEGKKRVSFCPISTVESSFSKHQVKEQKGMAEKITRLKCKQSTSGKLFVPHLSNCPSHFSFC